MKPATTEKFKLKPSKVSDLNLKGRDKRNESEVLML